MGLLPVLLLLSVWASSVSASDLISVESPEGGEILIHPDVHEKMRLRGSDLISLEDLREVENVSDSDWEPQPNQKVRVLFTQGRLGRAEAALLAEEFDWTGPVIAFSDRMESVKLCLAARAMARQQNASVARNTTFAYVASPAELTHPDFEPLPDVKIVVYAERDTSQTDPYVFPHGFEFRRVDSMGRDKIVNLLRYFSLEKWVSRVSLVDLGGESTRVLFELLSGLRTGTYQEGSPIRLALYDLTLDGKPGHWGNGAFEVMAVWDRVRSWLSINRWGQVASDPAMGIIETDFRFYLSDAASWERGQLARARLEKYNPRVPTDVKVAVDTRLRQMREKQLSREIGRNVTRLSLPGFIVGAGREEQARGLIWERLSQQWLLADAILLGVLSERLETNARYGDRIVKLRELHGALAGRFDSLLAENALDGDALYGLRRSTFGRGVTLGGRWKPALESCRDRLLLREQARLSSGS